MEVTVLLNLTVTNGKTTLLIDVTEKSALCDNRICIFFSLVKPFDT